MAAKIKKVIPVKMAVALTEMLTVFVSTAAVYAANPEPISQESCADTRAADNFKTCVTQNQIVKDLQAILNALSIGVGILIAIMIITGGIQYMAAGDSAEGVSKAKKRITNALIALVAFIFLDAFLQWLVPGGVFG